MINNETATMSDNFYATEIRETIKKLSKLVNDAEAAGLVVTLALGGLGRPDWKGFVDAAQIIRKY